METRTFVLLGLPLFLGPIAIDLAASTLKGSRRYRMNDLLTNLSLSLLSTLGGLALTAVTLGLYVFLYQRYALLHLVPGAVATWLLAFIAYDFLYYWAHRAHHEVALLWTLHSVHHSGEDMNFGLALRQSVLGEVTTWPFFLPLALLGIAPEVYLGVAGLQLVYQYSIHNTFVPALGPVERLLVTPSQHRVHHSRNLPYIDKNYGNILVLWDRLFRSYQPELAEHPPVYGLRHSLRSSSPLAVNFRPLRELLAKARGCRSFADKALCLVRGPAWQPASIAPEWLAQAGDDGPSATFQKHDPRLSARAARYCVVQFAGLIGASIWLLWNLETLSALPLVVTSGLAIAQAIVLGRLLDGRPGAWQAEGYRLLALALLGAALLLLAGAPWVPQGGVLLAFSSASLVLWTGPRQDARSEWRKSPPEALELQWLPSLAQLDPEEWASCFPREDVLKSYALHRAIEEAKLPDVEFHYLRARGQGRTLAIIPCFRIRLSLTTLAPGWLRRPVSVVRRRFPGFLCVHAFVAGTPIATCRDLLGIQPGPHGQLPAEVLRAVTYEVLTQAKRLGGGLVVVKELTSQLLPQVRDVLSELFTLVESPATTYLYLGAPGSGAYRERLRKKYRSLMNNRQRKLQEAGMRWELCSELAPYAERMHALYLQVLDRSKVRFETLSRDFFEALSRRLGESAFALLCFQGETLVAFELFLEDGEEVHPLYLGMDYRHRDKGSLYFNCIYQVVEVAESRGKAVVELGQTSYDAKASIGAVLGRLYLAVRHTNPALHLLLRGLRGVLFPSTPAPRRQRVFRDMDANDEALARYGIPREEAAA